MTLEQEAQGILDAQGYLIMATDKEYRLGEIVNGLNRYAQNDMDGVLDHKLVVIGEATQAQFVAQCVQFLHMNEFTPARRLFYKLVAE